MSPVRSVSVTLWSGLLVGSVAAIIFLALVNPVASEIVNRGAIVTVISIGAVVGVAATLRIAKMTADGSAEVGA